MSIENPEGLGIWLSGQNTTKNGALGEQVAITVEEERYQPKHYRYSHHGENQALEGFTIADTLRGVAHLIKAWRRRHGDLPVVIGGTSLGGWIATLVATDPDNNVNGLLLLNPSLNMFDEYLKRATKPLPSILRHPAQYGIWAWYAYLRYFRYYVPKPDGSKLHHYMPQSLLRDAGPHGYDVMERVGDANLPIFAATPSPAQEGFLASVELCNAFCDEIYASNGNWPPIQERDQNNLGHGGNKQLTADNLQHIRMLLQRATGHHRQQQQKLAEVGSTQCVEC